MSMVDVLLNHPLKSRSNNLDNQLQHFLLNGKAQRWLCCEWFYSDSDWCLLGRENEFENCLRHFFPRLVTLDQSKLELNRHQWNQIRRRFGKPRRFSSAYLQSERLKLSKQRKLLRILQYEITTQYTSQQVFLNNLPSYILPPLQPGARVIVRLIRSGQNGLFRGQLLSRVEGSHRHQYRIVFDDATIGLMEVNDCDVMSEVSLEQISLVDRIKMLTFGVRDNKDISNSDLEDEDPSTINALSDDDEVNSTTDTTPTVPDRLLYLVIRVSRILCAKRDSIANLRKMHDQAEFERSRRIPLSHAFRRDYAQLIQWLAKLNERLGVFIEEINKICRELVTDEQLLTVFNDTKVVCDRSERLAKELVARLNTPELVMNEKNVELITKLVALVVQMKGFTESEGSFLELHALDEANVNMKKSIHPSILSAYKQCVESSITQFKSGLNQRPGLGALQSFLHPQSQSTGSSTNSSSLNQTFFSV